ncbi:CDGSH iron-sulfur domain-containing protein 2 homolog B-like [Ruditapes philippinarum]|uniref:CDGSH iron-sulfur domain-containing protein 2 homolog B-like n=1 Tax=Ruditapes philippinarum TaxID=129788 RepID=UPI00295A987B|nr:CDGSH iron-sulfur domain-containing protein 2 homolog B-like [Ruditapes philippinarum]
MEVLSSLIRVTIPNYLRNVPVPTSIMGFARLSGSEWLQLLPFVGMLSLLSYVTYQAFRSKPAPKDSCVNLKIQKESSKVVNMVDIEELGDKVSYCRCWRSKKFPICDGSHNKHNEETGDNVGPLVLKRKEPLSAAK